LKNYFKLLFIPLFLFVSCNPDADYKKLIFKIENENLLGDLKAFDFTQRGEFNWMIYNDSIQFVYHKNDTQNYIFSSTNNPIIDSLGKMYFPIINTPQKIYFYNSDNKYSAKRIYVISGNMKSDSVSIKENDYLNYLFARSDLYYGLSKDFKISSFIYHRNQGVYEFVLNPDERLFYVEDLKKLNSTYKDLFKKNTSLNNGWFIINSTK
jgi:hypothetical protein